MMPSRQVSTDVPVHTSVHAEYAQDVPLGVMVMALAPAGAVLSCRLVR
jgi:hypothetical protein